MAILSYFFSQSLAILAFPVFLIFFPPSFLPFFLPHSTFFLPKKGRQKQGTDDCCIICTLNILVMLLFKSLSHKGRDRSKGTFMHNRAICIEVVPFGQSVSSHYCPASIIFRRLAVQPVAGLPFFMYCRSVP